MSHRPGSNGKTEYRRTLVATILVQRPSITQRSIRDALGKQLQNPETGKPYTLATIHKDIKAVKKGWQEKAERTYGKWIADEIGKLDALEAKGWATGDHDLVLKCMARRAKMIGYDKPDKIDLGGTLAIQSSGSLTIYEYPNESDPDSGA